MPCVLSLLTLIPFRLHLVTCNSLMAALLPPLRYCDTSDVLEIRVMYTGNWLIPQSMVIPDGDDRILLSLPLISYLVNTTAGYVLIGSSAEPRPMAPYEFPVMFQPGPNATITAMLESLNISTTDIRHILLWSLESDNTGGLKDFPNATIWCSEAEYAFATGPNATSLYVVKMGAQREREATSEEMHTTRKRDRKKSQLHMSRIELFFIF